jgi:hypothetical protein
MFGSPHGREEVMANETHISKIYRERAKFSSRQFFADLEHTLAVSRQEGIAAGRLEAARAMLSGGTPLERVIKYTGLTEADLTPFLSLIPSLNTLSAGVDES